MKIRPMLFALGAIILFTSLLTVANATQQSKERLIQRLPVEENEPIAITDIKVNDRSVSLDKRFNADDEWLRSLVISVKNKSDKRILFASLQLQFPRPEDSKARFSIFEMFHGNWSLRMRPPAPEERLVGIAPGETVEIQLSPQGFVDLRQLLTGTNYPASIEKVDLRIDEVIFEDDMMWSRGTQLSRDPNDRSKWTIANSGLKEN